MTAKTIGMTSSGETRGAQRAAPQQDQHPAAGEREGDHRDQRMHRDADPGDDRDQGPEGRESDDEGVEQLRGSAGFRPRPFRGAG